MGNLPRPLVLDGVDRFGWWHFPGRARGEHDVVELWTLREQAERVGAVRRQGRRLDLTRSGRALLADPEGRWRAVAASLTAGGGFEAAVTELALTALLAGTNSEPEPLDLLAAGLAEDGWQERGSGQPPSGQAVRTALAALVRPARLFGLLTPGDVWSPLPTGLTELGRATALEGLRTRAAGPRSVA